MEKYIIRKTEFSGVVSVSIFRDGRKSPVAECARDTFPRALNAAFNSIGISWNPAGTSYIRARKDRLHAIEVSFMKDEEDKKVA